MTNSLRSVLKSTKHLNVFSQSCRHLSKEQENYTHFGYENVKEDEKSERVRQVFSNVAEKYDTMNDAMSFGLHRVWKNDFINLIKPKSDTLLLDVAGGTGDITFRYIERLKQTGRTGHNTIPVVNVCDINNEMLEVGKKRAKENGTSNDIVWSCGDAESLPFESNQFDLYTIAFGIRNCTHLDKVLSEAYRVLKPGGRFMCLEFSEVNNNVLKNMYDFYSFQAIPVMGEVIAGDWKSYQYLVESIRKFPNAEEFKKFICEAGFNSVSFTKWTFGVVAVHSGFKL